MPAQSPSRSGDTTEPQVLRPAHPPATALRTVAELTGARLAPAGVESGVAGLLDEVFVTGIEQRSNAVRPGDLFVGLAGAHAHGARFAADAVARGAVAVLTDPAGLELLDEIGVPVLVHDAPRSVLGELSSALYGDPSRKLRIIGITGTSGKTTTSYLVETGLAAGGFRTALIGTIETRIGGHRVPSALTTPEAPQLHAMFALMVEQGVQAVVMEVSSHALALGRVDGVHFTVGAFTNLSQDHLDFHSDFEDYYAAKRRLFIPDGPDSAASPRPSVAADTAVVCVDDQWGRRLAAEIAASLADDARTIAAGPAVARPSGPGSTALFTSATADFTAEPAPEPGAPAAAAVSDPLASRAARLVTVSTAAGTPADWTATSVMAGIAIQEFTASGAGVNLDVRLRLPGAYNIANGLLAVAVCAAAGAEAAVAAAALAEVDVPGRMQRVDAGQKFLAVVDYAHKPAAIESVVATLRTLLAEQGLHETAELGAQGGAGQSTPHSAGQGTPGGAWQGLPHSAPEGRLAVVVGAGGDRDAGKRPLMGAAGARGADLLIITDDNPRSEDPAAIRAAVRAGAEAVPASERGTVREIGDRAAAIGAAVDWAQPGDVVLVAGKGHETGQEIAGVKHPFDDREVLAAALSRKTRDLTHS